MSDFSRYLLSLVTESANREAEGQQKRIQQVNNDNLIVEALVEKQRKDDLVLDEFEKGDFRTLEQKMKASKLGTQVNNLLVSLLNNINNPKPGKLEIYKDIILSQMNTLQELAKEDDLKPEIFESVMNFVDSPSIVNGTVYTDTQKTAIKRKFTQLEAIFRNTGRIILPGPVVEEEAEAVDDAAAAAERDAEAEAAEAEAVELALAAEAEEAKAEEAKAAKATKATPEKREEELIKSIFSRASGLTNDELKELLEPYIIEKGKQRTKYLKLQDISVSSAKKADLFKELMDLMNQSKEVKERMAEKLLFT